MRTSLVLLAAGAAAITLGAASAASASVFISFDGSTTLFSQLADGPYHFNAVCTPSLCGGFGTVSVGGSTDSLPALLHSDVVDATTDAGVEGDLTIYVTRTGISSPDYTKFKSAFTDLNTGNDDDVTPFTVTETTYYSTSNALYGGTQLGQYINSSIGASADNQTDPDHLTGGAYSVTEVYHIQAAAFGQSESASPTIAISGRNIAVPEPATWGLMLVGFGGMGALLRNRRRTAAVAA